MDAASAAPAVCEGAVTGVVRNLMNEFLRAVVYWIDTEGAPCTAYQE